MQLAMKEKAMAKLERDKMLKKMDQLEAALSGLQSQETRMEDKQPKKKRGQLDSDLPTEDRMNP